MYHSTKEAMTVSETGHGYSGLDATVYPKDNKFKLECSLQALIFTFHENFEILTNKLLPKDINTSNYQEKYIFPHSICKLQPIIIFSCHFYLDVRKK